MNSEWEWDGKNCPGTRPSIAYKYLGKHCVRSDMQRLGEIGTLYHGAQRDNCDDQISIIWIFSDASDCSMASIKL